MGEKKPAEPMGLAVMRERFRMASKSSVVNWEPHEVESMALTLEALAEVHRVASDLQAPTAPALFGRLVAETAIAVARVRQ